MGVAPESIAHVVTAPPPDFLTSSSAARGNVEGRRVNVFWSDVLTALVMMGTIIFLQLL